MPQPGTTPIAAPIDTTALGDTYPTHKASRGLGGFMSVADNTARDAISALRREEGQLVFVIATGLTWQLQADLTSWVQFSPGGVIPTDILTKPVYDPTNSGSVVDSDKLGGELPAYYLDLGNGDFTGLLPQANVNGLAASLALKVNTSVLGAPTGVPVMVGGVIQIANLPFAATAYLGTYNGTTNVPTLTNGVGTAGQWVITTVAGAAGPQGAVVVADVVVYDGAVWQVGPSFTGGIASVNGDSGPVVVLDLDDIADTATRFAVDADVYDAGVGSDTPSASNVFVTESRLTSAFTAANTFITPETFSDGQTLGDGTSRMLNTLTDPRTSVAYTNISAAVAWPRVSSAYGMAVTTQSIDFVACQEMAETMKFAGVSTVYFTPGRCYVPSQPIVFPLNQASWSGSGNRRSNRYSLDMSGSCIRNLSATNFAIISRYPANQAEADAAVTTSFDIRNGAIFGRNTSNAADIGIKMGAHSNSEWRNLHVEGCGINILNEFCLTSAFYSIDVQGMGTYGFANRNGTWSGAGLTNAQCNANSYFNLKTYNNNLKTPIAAFYQFGGYGASLYESTFEGASGSQHHVLYETAGGPEVWLLNMDGFKFETAGVTRAGIKIKAFKGSGKFQNWQNIIAAADMAVLFEAENVAGQLGAPTMYIQNMPDTWDPGANEGLLRSVNNNSTLPGDTSQPWEPRWSVHYTQLPNNTTLNTAANFNTGVANAFVPQSAHCQFTPLLG